MSTLAVCGINTEDKTVRFSEDCLDIGQEFQNSYEKTKFMSEKILNKQVLEGANIYIYRTGNVSGHSKTSQFQRNATANRLIQFVNACIKLGALPMTFDERIKLSPVDIVAEAVVLLSLDPTQLPGVYHVDTPHDFSILKIFKILKQLGFDFKKTKFKNFGELFNHYDCSSSSDLALGKIWATRKPRNVIFDNTKTLRTINNYGLDFFIPTEQWISSFVKNLVETGDLYKSR
jgi:thioester reductase-like protein